jgi:hypothetical protein
VPAAADVESGPSASCASEAETAAAASHLDDELSAKPLAVASASARRSGGEQRERARAQDTCAEKLAGFGHVILPFAYCHLHIWLCGCRHFAVLPGHRKPKCQK